MLAREGGVEKALEAVPFLHDETHAYIKTVSLLAKNPALGDLKNWQGMSSKAALGVTKNYTSAAINDAVTSTFAAGQAAIEPIVNSLVPDAAVDPAKWNATTTLMNNIGDAVAGPLNDQAFLDNLNTQLAQFNIVVTPKIVGTPSKFTPAAAIIARAATGEKEEGVFFSPPFFIFLFFCLNFFPTSSISIVFEPSPHSSPLLSSLLRILEFSISFSQQQQQQQRQQQQQQRQQQQRNKTNKTLEKKGVSLSATGVNFAPCLISIAPTGVAVGGQALNIAPVGVGIAPIAGSVAAQGVNLQVRRKNKTPFFFRTLKTSQRKNHSPFFCFPSPPSSSSITTTTHAKNYNSPS